MAAGSPVINAGNDALAVDADGNPLGGNGTIDIGVYESEPIEEPKVLAITGAIVSSAKLLIDEAEGTGGNFSCIAYGPEGVKARETTIDGIQLWLENAEGVELTYELYDAVYGDFIDSGALTNGGASHSAVRFYAEGDVLEYRIYADGKSIGSVRVTFQWEW